jgi:antirestriction protein ArdC
LGIPLGAIQQEGADMKISQLMEKITVQILEDLENGVLPWKQPWIQKAQFPENAVTGRPYRGINVFWLSSVAEKRGYSSASRWPDQGGLDFN